MKMHPTPLHKLGFSAMWYIRDTPLEMGPTQLLRGSHLSPSTRTKEEALNEEQDLLSSPALSVASTVVPRGSLLIFNHRLFHRTDPQGNRCTLPRDIITNAYSQHWIRKTQLVEIYEGAEPNSEAGTGEAGTEQSVILPDINGDGSGRAGIYRPPWKLLQDGPGTVLWQLLGPEPMQLVEEADADREPAV
jgi:hypothetical protein